MNHSINQLQRLRWAVRAVLTAGVAASVAANILHADPNPISQTIAAWPSLAFLLTVELVSRIPVTRRFRAAVRIAATAVIASIAGWISYWHMVDVAARYGESADSAHLLPFTVDGLIVVASVSLVELAVKIAKLTEPAATEKAPEPTPEPIPVPQAPPAVPVFSAAPTSPAPAMRTFTRPRDGQLTSPLTGQPLQLNGKRNAHASASDE
jgi:hypothetical protein